jgi:hypothetical protein
LSSPSGTPGVPLGISFPKLSFTNPRHTIGGAQHAPSPHPWPAPPPSWDSSRSPRGTLGGDCETSSGSKPPLRQTSTGRGAERLVAERTETAVMSPRGAETRAGHQPGVSPRRAPAPPLRQMSASGRTTVPNSIISAAGMGQSGSVALAAAGAPQHPWQQQGRAPAKSTQQAPQGTPPRQQVSIGRPLQVPPGQPPSKLTAR